ncbi:hypothetical protein AB7310_12470 [Cylindrospermopsis raciborskii UAM/DH-BiRr]|uniref:hypothetical protein n=1 Tax=Cylindrospermopsis raciborskii TaxID=77022 RepID=UPI00387A35D1
MNIWIVTIGNSDIRLGDKLEGDWQTYYGKKRHLLSKDHHFKPVKLEDDTLHTVPARVLGTILGSELNDKIYNDLHFPLLDVLSNKLQEVNPPDRIIIILTDQNKVYEPKPDKRSPYWKDTCTLKPIVEKYLNNKFPESKVEDVRIEPESKAEGLDNWDKSLNLVRRELSKVEFTSLNDIDNVYVSHQAGTPAISSAIQFVSLVKFGKKVQFLVSNEYEPENTRFIRISNYLRGLKLQEAKILLKRFDYSGVQSLLKDDLLDDPNNQDEKIDNIKNLLNVAIKWNTSKAEGFIEELKKLPKFEKTAEERLKYYWWPAYEAAYLAVVRIEQGNSVEALFHSFRSVEGLIVNWLKNEYPDDIKNNNGLIFKRSIIEKLPNNIRKTIEGEFFDKKNKKELPEKRIDHKFFFQTIKKLEINNNSSMRIFYEHTKTERNKIFHNILGLSEEEVFKAWETTTKDHWQKTVLECLNFITGKEKEFNSLEDASIMYQVHEEIVRELENYESTCLYT